MLLAYARRYAASIGWKTEDRALARGQGIEDLVQDAMASLYGGSPLRRWNETTTPDPFDHLKSFVNSRLSTLARSYDNRRVKHGVDPEEHADPDTPESLVLMKETREADDAWRKRAVGLLHDEILADELLIQLHDLMEKEDIDTPAELARQLGVSVEDVKNAKKRFRRAWERVVQKMATTEALDAKEARHG
jgi:DNA-directed RNA polymerase specialized sigma24 family protein